VEEVVVEMESEEEEEEEVVNSGIPGNCSQ
jgi:hypothetical protein